jgi:hypothetical protein
MSLFLILSLEGFSSLANREKDLESYEIENSTSMTGFNNADYHVRNVREE